MKIYLDSCALSRQHDDLAQMRIRKEAEALVYILSISFVWVGSEVIDEEIAAIKADKKRNSLRASLMAIDEHVQVTPSILVRADELVALGFKKIDAAHLACAESAGADWFLTTDDLLLRRAQRYFDKLDVAVENPATWMIRFGTL